MFPRTIIFLIIFLAVIFQVSFFPNFFGEKTIPDAVLLIVMFWSARKGFEMTLFRTVAAGFMLDLAIFGVPGMNMLSFALVAFGIGFLSKRFLVSDRAWRFFIILCIISAGTIANMAFLDIFSRIYGWANADEAPFFQVTLASYARPWVILSNLILFALIYYPMMRLEKSFDFYEARMSNQRKLF